MPVRVCPASLVWKRHIEQLRPDMALNKTRILGRRPSQQVTQARKPKDWPHSPPSRTKTSGPWTNYLWAKESTTLNATKEAEKSFGVMDIRYRFSEPSSWVERCCVFVLFGLTSIVTLCPWPLSPQQSLF